MQNHQCMKEGNNHKLYHLFGKLLVLKLTLYMGAVEACLLLVFDAALNERADVGNMF